MATKTESPPRTVAATPADAARAEVGRLHQAELAMSERRAALVASLAQLEE